MLVELLKLGIPYEVIMQADEEEINNILGVHYAINEYTADKAK